MKVNYKNLFYIFHLNGKFTEEELKEVLDAAYEEGRKKGYNDGFEAGKNSHFTITYPSYDWWKKPYYEITCNNTTSDIDPTITTTLNTNPPSITTTTSSNMTITKSQNPYGMEFKYYGTER